MSVPTIVPIQLKEYESKQSKYNHCSKLPMRALISGPSGSGKSILLDALGLAIGIRADSDLIRQGRGGPQKAAAKSEASASYHEVLGGVGRVLQTHPRGVQVVCPPFPTPDLHDALEIVHIHAYCEQ